MTSKPKDVQGEGNYDAARRYDDAQAAFATSSKVAKRAKEAEAALDGAEGPALEAARRAAAKGKSAGAKPKQ
jgi:hypothetical protein